MRFRNDIFDKPNVKYFLALRMNTPIQFTFLIIVNKSVYLKEI